MIKAALIFGSMLALGLAASLYQTADEGIGCLYQDEMWGSTDGTKWYVCDSSNNTAIEFDCPENTFFVRNSTASGCMPLDLVDPACTGPTDVGPCTGDNLKQPQASQEPAKFYLCVAANAAPVLLPCPEGKAFVKQRGYLGCFQWAQWRTLRNCTQ